jgi:hypothetical protein
MPSKRPVFARAYARAAPMMERGGLACHRRTLLGGLAGRVIEIGAGTGLNFETPGSGSTGSTGFGFPRFDCRCPLLRTSSAQRVRP